MRFMLIVKASALSESEKGPTDGASAELMAAMGRFNEEMMKAGVLLAGEGLHPSSKGARVRFSGGKTSVIDGPFAETKELIAGYWLIEAKSPEEAIAWARRSPAPHGPDVESEIEVRRVYEAADFPPEMLPPEAAAREQQMRDELAARAAQK